MRAHWSADQIQDPAYRAKFINVPDVIVDWLSEHGGIAGRDVLDFGCGEATTALGLALRHNARRVVGVDTHGAIDNAAPYAAAQLGLDRLPDNLHLVQLSAQSQLDSLGMFDVVYSWSVFEHVSQELIDNCFAKLKRVLRPQGFMFLQTTPLYYSAKGAHLYWMLPEPWVHLTLQHDRLYAALRERAEGADLVKQLTHVYETLNRTTAAQLLRAAKRAGFAVIREYRTYDDVPVPEELKEIYTTEVLTNDQLVFLAKHA